MRDAIFETLDYIIDLAAVDLSFGPDDMIAMLEEAGFMIVPIEDPTNLRFGSDE